MPAANRGKVVYADDLGIYGQCVIIDHGLGLQTLYGHLSRIGVKVGDQVQKGQIIGNTGDTGLAGGGPPALRRGGLRRAGEPDRVVGSLLDQEQLQLQTAGGNKAACPGPVKFTLPGTPATASRLSPAPNAPPSNEPVARWSFMGAHVTADIDIFRIWSKVNDIQ